MQQSHKNLNLNEAQKKLIQARNTSARECEICGKLVEVKNVRRPAREYCTLGCKQWVPSRMNQWNGKSTPTIRQGPFGNAQNNYLKGDK